MQAMATTNMSVTRIESRFVAGFTETLPITIWTSLRQGISPKVYALPSVIILVSLAISLVSQLWVIHQNRLTSKVQTS